jgi:riboflavin biosynthesis pyrimidine reductase
VKPLDVLYEASEARAFAMPEELETLYGGALGFAGDRLFANFVSTLDGVVAIPSIPQSHRLINRGNEADRFLMGLLRACADAIVIGSGTFHGSPHGRWTPEAVYPPLATAFAELRRARRRPPQPELVVLTASGSLDSGHPALERGALIVTTEAGENRLRGRLPPASSTVALGPDGVDVRRAVALLRERGHSLILSESGPHVFGAMLAADLVDELFLTLSPMLAGRPDPDDRLQLVEDVALLPDAGAEGDLLSIRASGAYLFLRYALGRAQDR